MVAIGRLLTVVLMRGEHKLVDFFGGHEVARSVHGTRARHLLT